jgi:putative cytosolic protein
MILGSAQSQTNSIKNLTTSQIGSYQQIQQALSNFMFQTNSLQGAAYDSAKAYCGSVLSPLIDGCILLNKAIEKANEEYINKYTSEVYGDSLKQSDLERLIDETKSQIALNENLLNEQFEQDPVDLNEVSNLQEKIDSYRKIQRDLEEKLSKLLAFDANSVSIFQEVDVLSYSVAQGIALAQRSWSPTLKAFMLPGKNEMGWVGTIKEIWEKNNKANNNKLSKGMLNDKLSYAEYDRMVAFHSGLHGKPIIGASVIHNASSEEKKDLVLAILPWIMPGGSLRLTMLSGGTVGLIDGLVSKDKPSDVIKKMAFGSSFAFASHLGFSLLGKGTKVKNFFKSGKNAEDKLVKNVKNESLELKNNLSQRGSINQVKVAESGIDGKLKPTILYNAKEFPRELKKYPRDMVLNNTNNKIITVPRNEKLRNNLVQKTTNEQSRLLNQIEKEKVKTEIVYGKKEFLVEMDKYPRVSIDDETRQMLVNIPKEKRPEPDRYLSPKEIEAHLKIFEEEGVAKIISKESLENSKIDYSGYIGPKEGQYATSEVIIEKAIKASDGDPRKLEKLLALDEGSLGENPVIIKPKKISFLKFPSGNEKGANAYWNPGGYTSGGIPEVVVNQFAPGEYTVKPIFKRS